jgi:hypothetical protein
MKKLLYVLSIGLIVVHAHGADRRPYNRAADSRKKNTLAQSQQLNQPNRSRQQNDNPLAQSQRLSSERSLEESRYSDDLSASTPLPTIPEQPMQTYKGSCLVLIHPYFYPGSGIVTKEALEPKSYCRKNKEIHMLFCARKHGGDWRVGYVACSENNGTRSLSESKKVFTIDITTYIGDLFSIDKSVVGDRGASINQKRRNLYGVSTLNTQEEALEFIRKISEKFLDNYFQEIDRCREEVRKEYHKSDEAPTTTTKSETGVTNTTDNT